MSFVQHLAYLSCGGWELELHSCLLKALVQPLLRKVRHFLLLIRDSFEISLHSLGGKLFIRIVGLLIEAQRIFHLLHVLVHSGVQRPVSLRAVVQPLG